MENDGQRLRRRGQYPSVYSFLYLDNKLLPDPHYRDNELIYTALAEHEYTFERKFDYVPTANATHLVFEGLDTLCSVYLNGKMIAETSNMHLKYSFDVSDTLVNGENVLSRPLAKKCPSACSSSRPCRCSRHAVS